MASLPWGRGRMALFVGALTVGKGLQSVIAAWPRVLQQVPDAHLVIVGSGSYREVLEGLVHAIAAGDAKLLDALVESGNDLDGTHASGPWLDVEAYLATPAGRAAALGAGPEFATTSTSRADWTTRGWTSSSRARTWLSFLGVARGPIRWC